MTHGAVRKQKLWLVAIRVDAGDVPSTPKPEKMEWTEWKGRCFPSKKIINTAYSIAAYFTRGSPISPGDIRKKHTLHLTYAPVWMLYALLRINILPVSINFFITLPQNTQVAPKMYSLHLGGCRFSETFLQNKGLKLMLKMNSVT